MKTSLVLLCSASLMAIVLPAFAEEPTTQIDKSQYTLFNPTPNTALRELYTDRPDVTESPYTVDAGHYQMEFSFVEYTNDVDHGVHTDGFSVAPFNLRVGLLNNLEADFMNNPYENIFIHGNGFSQRNAGFGDSEIRAKINFWGDDGGATSFGLIPLVRFPTGTDGLSTRNVEGGLIVPLAIKLPHDFDLGTMAEFDIDHNDDGGGYGLDLLHTITLDYPLTPDKKLYGYVEYAGISPISTGHTYLAYFDTGLTYAVRENVQLDFGINVGLSGHADDFTLFTGLSFRI